MLKEKRIGNTSVNAGQRQDTVLVHPTLKGVKSEDEASTSNLVELLWTCRPSRYSP